MKIHQRHMLKNKDVKELREKLIEIFGESNIEQIFAKKSTVEWIKLDGHEELIAIGGVLSFWYNEDRYIPLLSLLINPDLDFKIKSVTVDKGAIRFVAKGADIMRPGIIEIEKTIEKDEIIKIQDPIHGRALAVGEALYNGEEMEKLDKGRVIKNIHTINDNIWAFSKEF